MAQRKEAMHIHRAGHVLADKVANNPTQTPVERETAFSFAEPDGEVTVSSNEKTIMRRLLLNDYFAIEWAVFTDDDEIIQLQGTMPVGMLTIKSSPRINNAHESVVKY